jgi:hypothetical protein
MKRSVLRSTLAWAILLAVGCSGGGGGCGGCSEPIPGGFPSDQRSSNAITARLSPDGMRYFEQNLSNLISLLNAGGLNVDVPCIDASQSFSVPVAGNLTVPVFACDVAGPSYKCTSADNDPASRPVNGNGVRTCGARALIESATITPSNALDGSANVEVKLNLRVNTGRIPVKVDVQICEIKCDIDYNSDSSGSPFIPINVTLNLKVDPIWGDILGFSVGGIDLGQIFDTDDLHINSSGGGFCSSACDLIDIGFIKSTLFNFLKGQLDGVLGGALDSFRCRPCDANDACPTSPFDPSIVATCDKDSKLCYVDKANGVCVPSELGLQGRIGIGSFLASFGGPADAALDLYAVAGGRNGDNTPTTYADNAGGLMIGVMGGTRSPFPSACVPPRTPPDITTPDSLDFDAAAQDPGLPPVGQYHLGLGVSGPFINKSMYDVYSAGTLCLNVDSGVTSFLSSSLFAAFLPSLGLLTHGKDAPLMIALRPKYAPEVRIGKGSTKVVNGAEVPDDPLLSINMKEVQLDFYLFIEERFIRLFSLQTDLSLPLSLKFDPVAGTIQPVLAGLDSALTNTIAQNSEILAEDPRDLANLLPKLIGLVQPVLGSALQPIALPEFNGLKIQVESARGAVLSQTGDGYQHLALYAKLAAGSPLAARVETQASVVQSVVPSFDDIRTNRAFPKAIIEARGLGLQSKNFKGYEFSYRIDKGLWSPFTKASRFEVSSPILGLQGHHQIEVIAREIGVGTSEDDTPVTLPFVVDFEGPKVRFEADSSSQTVRTVAHDAVWASDKLSYRYRVGNGSWSSPGAAIEYTESELKDGLDVEVTDGAGQVTTAHFGDKIVLPQKRAAQAMGCSQTAAPALALVFLALWLARRARRA